VQLLEAQTQGRAETEAHSQSWTVKVLCQPFYRALVQDGSGVRDYRPLSLPRMPCSRQRTLVAPRSGCAGKEDVTTSNTALHIETTRDGSDISSELGQEGVAGIANEGGRGAEDK